jgi:hypothetical protein
MLRATISIRFAALRKKADFDRHLFLSGMARLVVFSLGLSSFVVVVGWQGFTAISRFGLAGFGISQFSDVLGFPQEYEEGRDGALGARARKFRNRDRDARKVDLGGKYLKRRKQVTFGCLIFDI